VKRREFIALLGTAAAWPTAPRAQSQDYIPKIGVLWHAASAEEEAPFFGDLEHVPPRLNRGDSRHAKNRRIYRH